VSALVGIPDVSEFQHPVDDSFNRRWLIFRACDGDYVDHNVRHNLAWAVKAKASGKIDGFTVYVVYRPGKNRAILSILNSSGVPQDCVVMIDAENWGGQIHGDHSADINALADALRARQGGDPDLVWGYGNRGPDLTVWPHKPGWMGWVVASYGGSRPDVPNLIGWQYTDGQRQYDQAGLPAATPPFGRCDHNVLLGVPIRPKPTPAPPPAPAPNPVDGKELSLTPEEKAYFDGQFANLKSLFNDTSGKPHRLNTWLSKLAGRKVDITPPKK